MNRVILVIMAVLMCTVIAMPVESVAQESNKKLDKGIDCSGVPFWTINTALGNKEIKYANSVMS